jgi:phosphatidate cytidylyltransferase
VFTSYLVIHIAILPILIGGVLWWMIVAPYCLWQYAKKEDTYLSRIVWQEAMGIIMFVPAWISLIIIRQFFGVELLFCLLIMIWTIDCGAYFVGVYLGQHLLVPMISPKKTWEGLFGGFFLALLVTVLWVNHLNLDLRFTNKVIFWIIIFITCLWSIIGDLFESMLKRISQVKDSGILLPGHGGLFDRMDSLIAALPIFTLGLLVI